MTGPGKYDDLCTEVRNKAQAIGAIVMILEGKHGWGFSVQAPVPETLRLPVLLRGVADQIEKDIKEEHAKLVRERSEGNRPS